MTSLLEVSLLDDLPPGGVTVRHSLQEGVNKRWRESKGAVEPGWAGSHATEGGVLGHASLHCFLRSKIQGE